MRAVVNTVSSFTISEVTGASPKEITLVGRGLPYRPYSLTTSQRLQVDWYPGNPEGTATVLGAKEDPTSINGAWKDKYVSTLLPEEQVGGVLSLGDNGLQANQIAPILLDNQPTPNVKAAANFVDQIVRGGQLIEVTWDDTTRRGYLRTFRKDWLTTRDLEWEMNFEWISRGEPSIPSVFTTEVSLSDAAGQLAQLSSDLEQEAADIPFAADPAFASALSSNLTEIASTVGEFQSAVTSVARQATAPAEAVRRAVALATILLQRTDSLVSLLFDAPAGTYNVTSIAALSPQQRLVAEDYNRRVQRKAKTLKTAAVSRRARLVKQIDRDLLAVVSARAGDDLRDISERFYGSPFDWRRLLIFNELTTTELTANQVILIPRTAEGGNC